MCPLQYRKPENPLCGRLLTTLSVFMHIYPVPIVCCAVSSHSVTLPARQRLSEAKLSADAALLDPALLQRCLLFYAQTCQLQLRQMGAQSGQLPSHVPDTFRAQLEWYIEDIAEFLLFTLQ